MSPPTPASIDATPPGGHPFVRQRLIYAGIFDESTRGLAASPPVRYRLRVEGAGALSTPVRCGRTIPSRSGDPRCVRWYPRAQEVLPWACGCGPRNEKFSALVSKPGSNVLMEFVATPPRSRDGCR